MDYVNLEQEAWAKEFARQFPVEKVGRDPEQRAGLISCLTGIGREVYTTTLEDYGHEQGRLGLEGLRRYSGNKGLFCALIRHVIARTGSSQAALEARELGRSVFEKDFPRILSYWEQLAQRADASPALAVA